MLPVPDSGCVEMPGEEEQRPGQDAEAGGAHQGVDQAELQPHALLSLQARTFRILGLETTLNFLPSALLGHVNVGLKFELHHSFRKCQGENIYLLKTLLLI